VWQVRQVCLGVPAAQERREGVEGEVQWRSHLEEVLGHQGLAACEEVAPL